MHKKIHDLEHTMLKGQDAHTIFDAYNLRFGETDIKFNLLQRRVEDEKNQ